MIVPPNPDWRWLSSRTAEKIGEAAARDPDIEWIQNAYAWLWNRLDPAQRESLPKPSSAHPVGPPFPWVPVLGVDDGRENGVLGFLAVDSVPKFGPDNDTGEGDEHRRNAYDAAKIVYTLFQSLDHDLGNPTVALQLLEGGGTSLSLPAMFGALSRILGVIWPDDIVSTGCLKDEKLVPVAPNTLPQKIDAAWRFGYKRLVLVKGQIVPENPGIETIFVDPDPMLALFDMLDLANKDTASDQRLARLLAVFAQKHSPDDLLSKIEEITVPFVKNASPLVRHVAFDILTESAMHEGKTEQSNLYRESAGSLKWHEFPNDWLGHYLRFERSASRAILAIDMGILNESDPWHRDLELRLEHLKYAINNGFADSDDYLATLAMHNARALRKQYAGRLENKPELLRRAWDDFIVLRSEWGKLFAYCKRIQRKDCTDRRQRNYCLGVLVDMKCRHIPFSSVPEAEDFLEETDPRKFQTEDAYDLIARLDRFSLSPEKEKPEDRDIQEILDEAKSYFDKKKRRYPTFLPYEKILRYGFGNDSQRSHAADQLRQGKHLDEKLSPTSILTLLALRTREVLAENGIDLPFPRKPPEGTPLRKIADELRSDDETLIDRCPY